MFDSWTSAAADPRPSVPAHYIDAPKDKPTEWALKAKALFFTKLDGNHSGENTANIIMHVVNRYKIHDKV